MHAMQEILWYNTAAGNGGRNLSARNAWIKYGVMLRLRHVSGLALHASD